ncbi:MAG: amidohydrolase family protein, partial [Chloroflexota bacterium]
DFGNPGVRSGMPVREMQLLQDAGLMPMDVLVASTSHSAQVCDMAEDVGTLEVGKFADIIIVNGNPLDDLSVMNDLAFIIANGSDMPINRRGSR